MAEGEQVLEKTEATITTIWRGNYGSYCRSAIWRTQRVSDSGPSLAIGTALAGEAISRRRAKAHISHAYCDFQVRPSASNLWVPIVLRSICSARVRRKPRITFSLISYWG